MTLVGCDLHTRKQHVAVLDTDTGEARDQVLAHSGDAVERFYAALPPPVTVGIEATGYALCFHALGPDREGQRRGPSQGSPREQRGKFHSLMGLVLDLRRLRAAYEAGRRNRGEPGGVGVRGDRFGADLEANLAALVVELRAQASRPRPVRRVWIPKPDGGQRPLGIPTI